MEYFLEEILWKFLEGSLSEFRRNFWRNTWGILEGIYRRNLCGNSWWNSLKNSGAISKKIRGRFPKEIQKGVFKKFLETFFVKFLEETSDGIFKKIPEEIPGGVSEEIWCGNPEESFEGNTKDSLRTFLGTVSNLPILECWLRAQVSLYSAVVEALSCL